MKTLLIVGLATFLVVGRSAGDDRPLPLLSNGNFEAARDGRPADWPLPPNAEWKLESTNHFLRLTASADNVVSVSRDISIKGAGALALTWRERHLNLKPGGNPDEDARIIIEFRDATGRPVPGAPPIPSYNGSSAAWRIQSLQFLVPKGAQTLLLRPVLNRAASGTFDLDDVNLTTFTATKLPPVQIDVNGKLIATADAGGKPPLAIHVLGNRVLDTSGAEVWLQGVNVPSLEWWATGEAVIASMVCAIETWKANIIRLPVHSKFWFGRQNQTDGGAAYRALVDQCILAASSRGVRIIVDLHRYRAPVEDDAAFWRDCAKRYKDHPAVLFGLLNEPHDVNWDVWLNGGLVTDKPTNKDVVKENNEALITTETVGMQALVDAVRGTGARNVLVIGGLDWAYDDSGFLTQYAPDDKGGNGYLVDSHVYPWKSQWKSRFIDVAVKFPVLLGEVGCDPLNNDFIPGERSKNPYTWAPDILACIQKNHLHWTAWSFHPGAGPCIIMDQKNFTPTPNWGAFVRSALLGVQYTSDTLR